MLPKDFNEIFEETELDSAKMILRLTSELREKDLELAALRTKSLEEIQRGNRAKEAEFETLIQSQEDRIKTRETEIARAMVEKETRLWHKHQEMLEEAISRHRAELEEERTRLNAEVFQKERQLREDYVKRLADNKNLTEDGFAKRAAQLESDYSARLDSMRESLEKYESELGRRQAQWEHKYAELRTFYSARETALETAKKEGETALLAREKELSDKYDKLQKELNLRAERMKNGLDKKEKSLEEDFAERLSELQQQFSGREKTLKERETKLLQEREELNLFRNRVTDTIHQRETELARAFEDRLASETARLAEQYRIKETGLTAQRDLVNAQVKDLEDKFMKALKDKEAESAESIKKVLAEFNAQRESRIRDIEKQAFASARHELELEKKKLEEDHQLKLRDLEGRDRRLEQELALAAQAKETDRAEISKLKEDMDLINFKLEELGQEKQRLIQENISKAKDLRASMEKEFMAKIENVEKNYLDQMADGIRRGEEREKNQQNEYFKKLEFIKEEYTTKLARQVKDLEEAHLERENGMRTAMEEAYKLKEKALATRYEQMERNHRSLLTDKSIQLDNDRSMAESVNRLKSELEARNNELKSKIAEHDKRLEEAKGAIENSYAETKKNLENEHRVAEEQLENERAKLKSMLEQEQRLIADLQKRESSLQGTYAAKETALAKEFELARERLGKDYQAKLKALEDAGRKI